MLRWPIHTPPRHGVRWRRPIDAGVLAHLIIALGLQGSAMSALLSRLAFSAWAGTGHGLINRGLVSQRWEAPCGDLALRRARTTRGQWNRKHLRAAWLPCRSASRRCLSAGPTSSRGSSLRLLPCIPPALGLTRPSFLRAGPLRSRRRHRHRPEADTRIGARGAFPSHKSFRHGLARPSLSAPGRCVGGFRVSRASGASSVPSSPCQGCGGFRSTGGTPDRHSRSQRLGLTCGIGQGCCGGHRLPRRRRRR